MIDRRKLEMAAYAAAAFVIVLLAAKALQGRNGGSPPATVSLHGPASPAPRTAAAAGSAPRLLVVDVAGEVRRPGVYRVPMGSRADVAVQQAGGVTRRGESAAVNLAMPLHDGQQIVVPRRGGGGVPAAGGASPGSPSGSGAGTAPGAPVSLSTATVEQLDALDGIGPTLAARIVQYREAHGGFKSIEELRQVDGIGDKRFESLRKGVQP